MSVSICRREALSRWRNNSGIRGTYWNLLELFVRAGHQLCAEAVCEVLRKKCEGIELMMSVAIAYFILDRSQFI